MPELDPIVTRRDLLRLALAVPIGMAVGKLIDPINEDVGTKVEEITDHPTYSAGASERTNELIVSGEATAVKGQPIELPQNMRTEALITAPIFEELLFRGSASIGIDIPNPDTNAAKNLVFGTGKVGFNRLELIMGAVSSVSFGLAHNLTSKGFDRKVIPVPQTILGGALWALQRKFGFAANLAAHSSYNYSQLKKKV